MKPPDAPPRFFGSHSRIVKAGPFTCTLSRATVPKEELPEHDHDDGHFILAVDRGYLSRAFDAEEQGRGLDLIYNPPGTVHRDCFHDPGGRYLSICFPAALSPARTDPVRLADGQSIEGAAKALGLCARQNEPGALELEEKLWSLVAMVSDQPAQLSTRWARQAAELIETRAIEPHITIAQLASELDLHPVYFARAYCAANGHGPAKALQARRIAVAAALLDKDMGLAAIASECGFADQSHLCRTLQSYLGISPTRLRAAFS